MTTETTDLENTAVDSDAPVHPFEQGLALYEQKASYDEIIPLFEQGVTLSPRDSIGYTCLTWLHILRRQEGDVAKALSYGQKAVRLDPSNYQAHFNLVLAMLINKTKGVRGEFQRAMSKLQTQEDQDEVVHNLNDALERQPELVEAQKILSWIQG